MSTQYNEPEVYPPHAWMDLCKALVPNEEVWALLEEWPWLEARDSNLTPMESVGCALLDVLAPAVGASFVLQVQR